MSNEESYNWIRIREPLLAWYRRDHRQLAWRQTKDPYRIWISEIMLQQTRVEAVKQYYVRFLHALPDVSSLACVDDERLMKLWEGLGYYNRARNLKHAAIQIRDDFGGVFPNTYDAVLSLKGIGVYTAGAICSICYDLPTPAVDGNVMRVMMRLADRTDNIDSDAVKNKARAELTRLYRQGDCGLLTQALMELGATVCVPNGAPKCAVCPVGAFCRARANGTYDQIPVRNRKRRRRVEEMTVFILHDDGYYGIRKRDSDGLLAGMWEFEHTTGWLDSEQAVRYVADAGFDPVNVEMEIPYTHVFTHVEWRMRAYYIACKCKNEKLRWVLRDELTRAYALPTAFRTFLEREP